MSGHRRAVGYPPRFRHSEIAATAANANADADAMVKAVIWKNGNE
jgi:hypothetical protein